MFPKPLIGKRGYDEKQVDDFLDEVEHQLADRTGHAPDLPGARAEHEATAERAAPPPRVNAPEAHFQER